MKVVSLLYWNDCSTLPLQEKKFRLIVIQLAVSSTATDRGKNEFPLPDQLSAAKVRLIELRSS